MKPVLLAIHIIVTILLIGSILIQNSKGGLGVATEGQLYRSRRGAEKILFTGTIVLTILFLITSIVNILVR